MTKKTKHESTPPTAAKRRSKTSSSKPVATSSTRAAVTTSSPKASSARSEVVWLNEPEHHDYPAASDYLSLIATPAVSERIVAALRRASDVTFKAKDILRAAQLDLLPPTNEHVAADLAKIEAGVPLSPILLVRGDITRCHPAQIADGYHRVCASYYVDENTDIPVRIVDAP